MTFMISEFRILARFVTVDVRNHEGVLKSDAVWFLYGNVQLFE